MDSPLAGFVFPPAGAVRLAEVPFLAQVNLRLEAKDGAVAAVGQALGVPLPVEPGTSARGGDWTVLWLGPDEWLVVGAPGAQYALVALLRSAVDEAATGAPVGASIVDVSAQRTTIEIAGDRALDLLAHGCALDLHPTVFPDGRCAQTMLAQAQVVLLHADGAYRVMVRSSYARYLAEWLLDAAVEYVTDEVS
jgi:sarcosine oxidase subunit gamma